MKMIEEIMPNDITERVHKLSFYAGLQNDSYGEGCEALANLWYDRSMLNTEFLTALEKEITHHLQNILDNTEMVEEIFTPNPYPITRLEWNDE